MDELSILNMRLDDLFDRLVSETDGQKCSEIKRAICAIDNQIYKLTHKGE